jgi:hypothetical protein
MIAHVMFSLGFALGDTRLRIIRTDAWCTKGTLQGGDREKRNEE